MSFLKTLFIIILVFYGLRILFRIISPYLFSYLSKKTATHFSKKFEQFQKQQTSYQEQKPGSVSVDKQPEETSKSSKKVGEYIDFEEIE